MTIGSRDLLSLAISAHNLAENGFDAAKITTIHQPTILDVAGPFDFIAVFPDFDSGVPWPELLPAQLDALLAPGAQILLSAKSGIMQRLLPQLKQFTPVKDKKRRGFRAVLMTKPIG
jgi:hypothetical protein